MKQWITILGILCCGLVIMGCDSGDDRSGESYSSFTFINSTGEPDGDDDKPITISRNGGLDWEGSDSFTLDDHGDSRTVTLTDGPWPDQLRMGQRRNRFGYRRSRQPDHLLGLTRGTA